MKKTPFFAVAVLIALSFMLSGCLKAASTSIPSIITPTLSMSGVSSQQPSMKDILSGTQTAMAKTQEGLLPTATPTPEPTQEIQTLAPTEVVVPTATPGRPETWALKNGEWPFCIARRYNLDIATLLSINGLGMDSRPGVGTVLKIPPSGEWPADMGSRALNPHPTSHTVSSGETIYSIACHYGDVDPNAIISQNSLQEPYTLTAGQVLQIP